MATSLHAAQGVAVVLVGLFILLAAVVAVIASERIILRTKELVMHTSPLARAHRLGPVLATMIAVSAVVLLVGNGIGARTACASLFPWLATPMVVWAIALHVYIPVPRAPECVTAREMPECISMRIPPDGATTGQLIDVGDAPPSEPEMTDISLDDVDHGSQSHIPDWDYHERPSENVRLLYTGVVIWQYVIMMVGNTYSAKTSFKVMGCGIGNVQFVLFGHLVVMFLVILARAALVVYRQRGAEVQVSEYRAVTLVLVAFTFTAGPLLAVPGVANAQAFPFALLSFMGLSAATVGAWLHPFLLRYYAHKTARRRPSDGISTRRAEMYKLEEEEEELDDDDDKASV
jgi:hypothetical protein